MFYSRGSFLYTPRHDPRTFVPTEKLFFISGVGFPNGEPSICGGSGPQCIITNLAYLDFDPQLRRVRLKSKHSGVEIKTIKESTGFDLIIPDSIEETIPPSEKELDLLRNEVDPLEIRKLEVLSGKERKILLNEIIEKEINMEKRYPRKLN